MDTPSFSYETRSKILESLEKDYFDVIIVGGGITGAGIALDAATRGLKTALIEKNDFASGTSSKSTKLIHGGLRYLKQFEFSLVREVGKERSILHKLAPNLVRPEKMLLPLVEDGTYGKIVTSVGLMVYDVLAGVSEEDQRKMLTPEETLAHEPLLDPSKLEGGGLYAEYQTDDFRLVMEIIKTSLQHGVKALNYTSCTDLMAKGGIICGIECRDEDSGKEFKIYGDYVINATGPWVDQIRKFNKKVKETKLHLTKGIHIVVPHDKLPVRQSVYFDVSDGRMIFAIPRANCTYVGTTDTDYKGDPGNVVANKTDVKYLLKAVNETFPSIHLKPDDILSSWAGIRPLVKEEGKSASEISRKDEIFISDRGLISIAGGKLTGYRKMAKRAVDMVVEFNQDKTTIQKSSKCKTKKLQFASCGFEDYAAVKTYKDKLIQTFPDVPAERVDYLVDLYGTETVEILNFADRLPGADQDAKLIQGEIRYCIEHEMVLHLTDFFIRRSGRLFFDIESVRRHQAVVVRDMKYWFNWSDEHVQKEIAMLQAELDKATKCFSNS